MEYNKKFYKHFSFSVLIILIAMLAGCAGGMRHPEKAYQGGKWKKAQAESETWLKDHPDDYPVIEIYCRSTLRLGDSLKATRIIQPYIDDLKNKEFRDELLDVSIGCGNLDLARTLIRSQAMSKNKNPELDQKFAIVEKRIIDAAQAEKNGDNYLADGDWTKAARFYHDATLKFPARDEYQAKLYLARAELAVGKGDQSKVQTANGHIDHAFALWKDSPLAWWVKGDIELRLGNDKSAREAFTKAVELGIEEPFSMKAKSVVNSKME